MSLLTGDADMSSIIKLLPQLIEGGEYKSLLGKMFNSYLSSSPLGSMISMYLGNVLDSEEGKLAINRFYEILEEFVKSKSYQRLTTIIPQLMAAKDSEQILMVGSYSKIWILSYLKSNCRFSQKKQKVTGKISLPV